MRATSLRQFSAGRHCSAHDQVRMLAAIFIRNVIGTSGMAFADPTSTNVPLGFRFISCDDVQRAGVDEQSMEMSAGPREAVPIAAIALRGIHGGIKAREVEGVRSRETFKTALRGLAS